MNMEQVRARKFAEETKKVGANPPPNRFVHHKLSLTPTWDIRQEAVTPATNCLRHGRCQIARECMRPVHNTICTLTRYFPHQKRKKKKEKEKKTNRSYIKALRAKWFQRQPTEFLAEGILMVSMVWLHKCPVKGFHFNKPHMSRYCYSGAELHVDNRYVAGSTV
jgi:hypothetical protein